MENSEHNASGVRPENQEQNAGNAPPSDITIHSETEYKAYKFNEAADMFSLVTLKAPCQVETDDTRAPVDLVFVIDRSGSMAGEKLKLVKKTMEFVFTQLSDKDRLSVVTYDDTVKLLFELRNMTKENKESALSSIKNIRDGGMTNLSGGLLKGLCQTIDRPNPNDVASVLLFTDGLANRGITNVNGIIAAMKDPKRFDGPDTQMLGGRQLRAPPPPPQPPRHQSWLRNIFGGGNSNVQQPQQQIPQQQMQIQPQQNMQQNITVEPNLMEVDAAHSEMPSTGEGEATKKPDATVYTFGFGADHDPNMLKQISDAGNGMYYYIENEEKIAESFAHCLGGLMSTVAQGIQLCVDLADGVHLKEVHTTRPYERLNEKSIKINIGDLQSEEKRDLVFELTLDPVPQPFDPVPQKVFVTRADYFNVITNELGSSSSELFVLRPAEVEKRTEKDASSGLRKEKKRLQVKKAMKDATASADSGDYLGARNMLKVQMDDLRLMAEENDDKTFDLMREDMDQCYQAMESSTVYRAKGSKVQRNMMQQYDMQRPSNLESKTFETGARMKKRSAVKSFMKK